MPESEPVRVEAAIAEPLLFRERLVGMVQVVRDAAGGPFSNEDAQALHLFARHAALVLDHHTVVSELQVAYGQLQTVQAHCRGIGCRRSANCCLASCTNSASPCRSFSARWRRPG